MPKYLMATSPVPRWCESLTVVYLYRIEVGAVHGAKGYELIAESALDARRSGFRVLGCLLITVCVCVLQCMCVCVCVCVCCHWVLALMRCDAE